MRVERLVPGTWGITAKQTALLARKGKGKREGQARIWWRIPHQHVVMQCQSVPALLGLGQTAVSKTVLMELLI